MASAIKEAAEEQQRLAQKFQATEEVMKKKKLQTETKTSAKACQDAKAASLSATKVGTEEGGTGKSKHFKTNLMGIF